MDRNEIIQFLKGHKPELEQRFGVIKIGLFGSYARNEAREDSDIDIAIEIRKENVADNFFGLFHYLEDNLPKKIDLGIESNIKPAIKKYIDRDIIYV